MELEFEINYTHWKIMVKPMQTLLELYNKRCNENADYCAGLTLRDKQTIWIAEETCAEQQILVLKHELAHCWIWSYGHYYNDAVNEEDICEVVSKSNNFINEVVAKFQKELDNGLSNIRTKD